jgi:uncharacterized protein YcbX
MALGEDTTTRIVACVVVLVTIAILSWRYRQPSSPRRISELWLFPVKSCAGFRVEAALMRRGGLQWDREFAVINADGEVLSQKTYPKLANIRPVLRCVRTGTRQPAKPGPGTTLVAIVLHDGPSSDSDAVLVDLTDDEGAQPCTTTWVGNSEPLDAVRYPVSDAWLTAFLGFEASLCRLRSRRALRTTRLAPVAQPDSDCCRYQDGAPLTVLSEASVDTVRRRFAGPLTPTRFRPNIVVSGCRPLEETRWLRVTVRRCLEDTQRKDTGARIRMLMDAYRCTMVTIAQLAEGEPGIVAGSRPQGLKLTKVLKEIAPSKPATHGPLPREDPNLAIFAAPEQDEALVRVGDELSVLETIDRSAGSIFAHNEAHMALGLWLDVDRFWKPKAA